MVSGEVRDTSSRAARAGAPRRIMIAELGADGTVGGSHQVLFDVARLLDRQRYEPVALFYENNRFVAKLRSVGVEVHHMEEQRLRERRAMTSGRRLRKIAMLFETVKFRAVLLARHRIDLLHINNSPRIAHDDWLPAARIRRIPVIANMAGNAPLDEPSAIHRMLVRRFDRVMPVSRHIEQQVLAFGHPPERVTMVHPGIDIDGFRARVRRAPGAVRAELGIAPDAFLIAMVGNVRAWKGQHVALEGLARLSADERARVRLLIIGATAVDDRPYEQSLHDFVQREALAQQVTFLGSREDVPDVIAASDVVLHASTDPEPFGLVVVEGMALGRVVIASSLGGPSEIIDSGSGLTFSPDHPEELAAHLSMLQANPEARRSLGEAGRRRAERFDIRHTVASDMQIYDELLGMGPTKR